MLLLGTWELFGYGRGTAFTLKPGNEVPFHLASRMGLLCFAGNWLVQHTLARCTAERSMGITFISLRPRSRSMLDQQHQQD